LSEDSALDVVQFFIGFSMKDLTVIGSIDIDGVIHHVMLPLPLLVQDGFTYLGSLVSYYYEAADSLKSSASAFLSIGDNILSASAGLLSSSGCVAADIRLSLRPLFIDSDSYISWCRALLSVSESASSEDSVSFRISSDGLTVCPSLCWLGEYTSACEFRVDNYLSAPSVLQFV